jgi:hypothetical protein
MKLYANTEKKKRRDTSKDIDHDADENESKIEGVDDTSMATSMRNDMLSRKIRIL